MTNILSQLWAGKLEPVTKLGVNNNEFAIIEKLMLDNHQKLETTLNNEQKDVLEKYSDCVNDYILLISQQSFCDGFCLGSKISIEALLGADKLL